MTSPFSPPNGVWRPSAMASRPADTPARGLANEEQAPRDHAWQREMERAQLATWFKATPAPSQVRPMRSSGPDTDHARVGSPSRIYTTPFTPVTSFALSPHTTVASASSSLPEPLTQLVPRTLSALNGLNQPGLAPEVSSTIATLAADIAHLTGAYVLTVDALAFMDHGSSGQLPVPASNPTSTPDEQPPPLRLYAEWQGQSVCVWLGMNADKNDIPRQLDALIPQLRKCLFARGARLTGLVCNGQSVLESSRPPLFTDF